MSEPLTVILLTYERTEYAVQTVKSSVQFLRYPDIRWFVCDDGSRPEHIDTIAQTLYDYGANYIGTYSEKHSYGRSANVGIQKALEQGQLMLFLEDDWTLSQPLDLWVHAALLMENPDVGMVRLGYLNAGVEGETFGFRDRLYWKLKRSTTPHNFTGHPSLRHWRFHEHHGMYPERLQPGETELGMGWQYYTSSGPDIVWPAEFGMYGPYGHIGALQSYVWNGGVPLEVP